MRFLNYFSMGIALATAGTLALSAFPEQAEAKKKKKKKKSGKLKVSDVIKPQVVAIQQAMSGENPASAKPLTEALLSQPMAGEDQYAVGQLAINLGSQLKDVGLQEKGINAALASGVTPAEQLPAFNYHAGRFAYSGGRYAEAQQRLQQAFDLGYRKDGVGTLIAEAYFKDNKFPRGLSALDRAIQVQEVAGTKAPEDWYRRGAGMALRSNDAKSTGEWTYRLVEAYPSAENWRAALSVYRDGVKLSNQENLELMRLMRKANAMASAADCAEYIEAAGTRRLPGEVVAVLGECKAKGIAGMDALFLVENLNEARGLVGADRASLPASARDSKSSSNSKIALATGDAFFGYSNFAKAAEMYQAALGKPGVDSDRANMGLGTVKANQGDWSGAKQAFAAIAGTNRKGIANLWTLWIDQQSAPEPAVAAAAAPAES